MHMYRGQIFKCLLNILAFNNLDCHCAECSGSGHGGKLHGKYIQNKRY